MRSTLLVGCLALAGCGFRLPAPTTKATQAAQTVQVSATISKPVERDTKLQIQPEQKPVEARFEIDVWREYGANEAAADARYTDKPVQLYLRGRVEKVGGRYVIASYFLERPDRFSPNMTARVREEDYPKLTASKPGATFKAIGICKGKKVDPGAWKGYSIAFEDCRILSVGTWRGGTNGTYHEDPR